MYLAHIDFNTGRCHDLREHCRSVADTCEKLGTKANLGSTAKLIGLLHDLGKANKEFIKYLKVNCGHLKIHINHSSCGARYIYERWQNGSQLQNLTSQIIALVVVSHHKGLIDCINLKGEDCFKRELYPQEEVYYEESVTNFLEECADSYEMDLLFESSMLEISKIFGQLNDMYKDCEDCNPKIRSFFLGLIIRYLLSCLVDADRLDTYFFNSSFSKTSIIQEDKNWDILSNRLEAYLKNLPQKSEIDKLRTQISLSCKEFSERTNGIYRLFVPIGGGKTLSSLRYALNFAKRWNTEHIFYVTPCKTITKSNVSLIRKVLRCDDMILEHHSDIVIEKGDEATQLLTERWNSQIVFTTMVLFMNTLFDGKIQSVCRMNNLSNSVIVFDEIQSMPAKFMSMFNSALQFLSLFCRSTIVLCTAVQPRLSSSNLNVPLTLGQTENMVPDYEEKFSAFKRNEVIDARRRAGYTSDYLVEFILAKLKDCSSVLTVLNTKKAVIKVFDLLKSLNYGFNDAEKFSLYHFSSRMCLEHRLKTIEDIKEGLNSGRKVVCVSTPLIETGIDVSFQCVIRSLAGLDSIVRSAGRCNRHGEYPYGDVYVINNNIEDLRKLPDIFISQESTKKVFVDLRRERRRMGKDLLSRGWITRYYNYYFHSCKDEMFPQLKTNTSYVSSDTDLYDLLSQNISGISSYKIRNKGKNPDHLINQAFNTASKSFNDIGEDAIGVIVPYRDGIRIISEICKQRKVQIKQEYMRQLQMFSVNILSSEMRALTEQDALVFLSDLGVTILKEEYYDDDIGLVFDKRTSAKSII